MNAIGEALRKASDHLRANREDARYTDSAAVARLDTGLKVTVTAPDGRSLTTDMVKGVGGTGTAPGPGWLYRAALASCDVTLIAMRAAMLSVDLASIEVTVDSRSDDYGILGLDDSVPAGPLSVSTRIKVSSSTATPAELRELVDWAVDHCPVCDLTKRAVPVTVEVDAG